MSIEKLAFNFNRTFCLYLDNKNSSLHAIESCAGAQQTSLIWQISFYKHTHKHKNDAEPIPTIKLKKLHCEDFRNIFTSANVISVIKWRKRWALLGKCHPTSQEIIVFERTCNCFLSWVKIETRTHILICSFHMFQCLLLLDLPIGLALLWFSDQNYL